MDKKENAVLTIVGKNDIGILAKAATAVADAKGSVVQVSQIVMDDFFTMNMLIDVSGLDCTIHQLEENIKTLGTYDIAVKLHPEVSQTVKVWVVAE